MPLGRGSESTELVEVEPEWRGWLLVEVEPEWRGWLLVEVEPEWRGCWPSPQLAV